MGNVSDLTSKVAKLTENAQQLQLAEKVLTSLNQYKLLTVSKTMKKNRNMELFGDGFMERID